MDDPQRPESGRHVPRSPRRVSVRSVQSDDFHWRLTSASQQYASTARKNPSTTKVVLRIRFSKPTAQHIKRTLAQNSLLRLGLRFGRNVARRIIRHMPAFVRITIPLTIQRLTQKLVNRYPFLRDVRVRVGMWSAVALVVLAEIITIVQPYLNQHVYALGAAGGLLSPVNQAMADKLKLDTKKGMFAFNADYSPSTTGLMQSAGPQIEADAYMNPTKGIVVTDPQNQIDFTMRPQFGLWKGQQDGNRVIYPITNAGGTGWVVYTMHAIGVKEDVVLTHADSDKIVLNYTLGLGGNLAARVESDGSIGVYGSTLLSGNVATETSKDAALLQKARQNAPKNTLLFDIPTPKIKELGQTKSNVQAKYSMHGSTLSVTVAGLSHTHYPLTIDPSIYVETAEKFMYGNNETNIDFDVADSLIEKGPTTGARFNSWDATKSLNTTTWRQGVAVAGGFIYTVGGTHPNGGTQSYTTVGNDTFTVPSGISSITVKAWGAGGGGGGAGNSGDGGDGGGAGFAQTTLSGLSGGETLDVTVGGGGGGGNSRNDSGDGGGGGGYSSLAHSGTSLIVAAGGAGGGGGGDSNYDGGAGGAGGGTSGVDGDSSDSAGGGGGGTQSSGGSGGTGGSNNGSGGSSLTGGAGGDGRSSQGSDGGANNGGSSGGGDGGQGSVSNDYAGAGGGGGGYYGGGGGSGSDSTSCGRHCTDYTGAGGGGGGSSYTSGTGSVNTAGSGSTPGNDADSDRGTAGEGGNGSGNDGTDGTAGKVVITWTGSTGNLDTVGWAKFNTDDGTIGNANPGNGTCSGWCTATAYSLPAPRAGLSLVAYNGFLYAIGGEDSSCTTGNGTGDGGVCDTVYIAKLGHNGEPQLWHPTDTDKNNWVYWYRDTDLSSPRSFEGAVAYENRMYLLGGKTSSGGSPSVVDTVEEADIIGTGQLGSWTTSGMVTLRDPSSPGSTLPRYGFGAQVYNNHIYVIGGASSLTSGSPSSKAQYITLNSDGTMSGNWITTGGDIADFSGATEGKMTNGGNFTTVWGAYIYISGGCTAYNSSGYCTSVAPDTQLASINADGSLDKWNAIDPSSVSDTRMGQNIVAWRDYIYEIGGCSSQDTTSGECSSALDTINYGTINRDGDASTVNTSYDPSDPNPDNTCTGSDPYNCNLPPRGSGTGQIGQVLNATAIMNGYLYVIGGCRATSGDPCNSVSDNTAYAAISSTGALTEPANCTTDGNTLVGAWCVDSSHAIGSGIAAAGTAIFGGRIYVVGGFNTGTNIYYNSVNDDGSLNGGWSSVDLSSIGARNVLTYDYAYARANPGSAGSNPGNLYIIGGCTDGSVGCSNYSNSIYKCNINTSGVPGGCSEYGQMQINDATDPSNGHDCGTGLGAMAGTVYANYIYLIGGLTTDCTDLTTVRYAKFDNNNNIVSVDGSGNWIQSDVQTNVGRRRGAAFGYNGYIYVVGGYDAGEGLLDDIEFAKINVSDGKLGDYDSNGDLESTLFNTSSVTLDERRWGLSVPVSSSYAYVIGGCTDGAAPTCATDGPDPTVTTFQVYNNDSGSPAGYSDSANTYSTDANRIGAGAVIDNGYIYVAGGCTGTTDCSSTTNSVEYASIDANGNIGTWSDASAGLPAARGWGKLEAAGGSLYWVGGQNSSGTAQSNVYYATPGGSSTQSAIRSTTYKLASGQFTGTTYTLTLNNNLSSNYFVMVSGADDSGTNSGADSSQIRVDADPFGNFGTSTSANQIELDRGSSTNDWVGSVTVVECLGNCTTGGFQLRQVKDVSLSAGSANSLQTTDVTLSNNYDSRTVPFGGYLGGGLTTTDSAQQDFSPTAGVRIQKTASDELAIERYGGGGHAPSAANLTIYVVEWGSDWTVQEANFDSWDAGGSGANTTGDYTTQGISSVTRANTWVWKTPGTSTANGLGNGSFGKIVTLGDGVNQNGTESTVAIGSDETGATRNDTAYVMSNSQLANDNEFLTQSSYGTGFTQTVDAATGSETYNTSGGVTTDEGSRVPLFYYSDTGTGTAYTRVAGWSDYYTNSTTMQFDKSYSGNNQPGWIQSVDFAGITYTPTSGGPDITSWASATHGLPSARSQFGAAVWNNRIYVLGGEGSGTGCSGGVCNTVYVSPQLNSGGDINSAWSTTSTSFNVDRSGLTAVAYANNLYVLGGYDGSNYLSDTQYAQIGTSDGSVGSWTYSTSLPGPLSNADGFAVNGYMYLIGGRSADTSCRPITLVAPISANTTIASGNNPTGVGDWYETNEEYQDDRYGAAAVYNDGKAFVIGGACGSTLSYPTHVIQQTTLLSQPQVAQYSIMFDTDSEVYPEKWLLNGLDNSIGAEWQLSYRSMTQPLSTNCATSAMTTWGETTDFGDVALGSPGIYTPKDGSGADTNCARFFYLSVTIDSSHAYGYPEDVTRGPTITDLTLEYESAPGKRLMHGRTFTGGLQEPDDTPF
jgi:Kelch motif